MSKSIPPDALDGALIGVFLGAAIAILSYLYIDTLKVPDTADLISPPPREAAPTPLANGPPVLFWFDTTTRIRFLSDEAARNHQCGRTDAKHPGRILAWACYDRRNDLIIVSNPCSVSAIAAAEMHYRTKEERRDEESYRDYVETLCHEMAHRNGWKHEEPS